MAPLASAKAGSFPRPFRVWNVRATPIAVEQPPWTAVCSAALAKLAQGGDHEKDTSSSDKSAGCDRDILARRVGGPRGRNSAAGQQFFATHCGACHATEPGVNKIGPSLAGVVGRKSGSAPGFNYSPALKEANITWDEKTLDQYLQNPTGDVHGSRMFLTVPSAADRQNAIAYLETLK